MPRYAAKDLPQWVRFKPKPKPRPMFGPPTKLQHMMNETLRFGAARLAANLMRDTSWFTSPISKPIRVRLPLGFDKE